MGVIYKLKPEVIQYIINQKKDIPKISCRKLADIVTEKFQIPVSKSSINTILKNAELSSPVGRRPGLHKKRKKFQIPEKQKKALFSSPETAHEKALLASFDAPKSLKSMAEEPPPIQRAVDQGILYDGMGAFFLRGIEWSVANEPILRQLLGDEIDSNFKDDLDQLSAVLLFMKVFGINDLESLSRYSGQGLWFLAGSQTPIPWERVSSLVKEGGKSHKLILKMSSYRPQVFARISCMRFELEDGGEFFIDGNLYSVYGNVHSENCQFLSKAIDILSNIFINNVQSINIYNMPSKESFEKSFYSMLLAFEDIKGKKIKTISFLNQEHQEIASFHAIPEKRRIFAMGVWPFHEKFTELIKKDSQQVKAYQLVSLQQTVYFSEGCFDVNVSSDQDYAFSLRVIFVRNASQADPGFAIITNAGEGDWAAEKIIEDYLTRWPNWQESAKEISRRETKTLSDEPYSEKDIFACKDVGRCAQVFLSDFNDYCQKCFFPEASQQLDFSSMCEKFYQLPGTIEESDQLVRIKLAPPESGYSEKAELQYAICRFNEYDVRDFEARKIVISI